MHRTLAKACNTTETWSYETFAACTQGVDYSHKPSPGMLTAFCRTGPCMSIAAAMKATNPEECFTGVYDLYAGFLTPLEAVCRMQTPSTTPTPPAPTPAPPPPSPVVPDTPSTVDTPAPARTTAKPAPTPSKGSSGSTRTPVSSSAGSASEDTSAPTTTSSLSPTPSESSATAETPKTTSATPSPLLSSSSQSAGSDDLVSEKRTGRPPSATEAVEAGTTSAASSSNTTTTVVVVAVVVFACVLLWIAKRWWQKKNSKKKHDEDDATYSQMQTAETKSSTDSRLLGGSTNELVALLTPWTHWRVNASDLRDVSLIGSGSQGTVFLVEFSGSKFLASKRIIRDQFSEKKLRALITEVSLVSSLEHPSIVAFAGVAWSTPFDFQVLFDYMPNGDLRSHLERTPRAGVWSRDKLRMALEIAEGLVFVHSFSPPIVHRDLKARNILLDNGMHTKISDFGVSRLQSENGTMSTGVGTSRWLAPEVITGGGAYTEQCDIYSFGVVLVEIDTHAVPFAELDGSLSDFKLLQQLARGEIRPQVSSTCDPQIASLVQNCLSSSPRNRPNALEVAFQLRKLVKESKE